MLAPHHRDTALIHLVGDTRAYRHQLATAQQELEECQESALEPLIAAIDAASAQLRRIDDLGSARLRAER